MPAITRESLMSLEAYDRYRKSAMQRCIERRCLRTVQLGAHVSIQFEDEQTIRRQIQEMLRIERVFDEAGVQSEIDAYAALVPDGSNWKATMFIEYPDVDQRKCELARMIGIGGRVFVEVQGRPRAYAIADEDMVRENDEKTSAVHFLRFEFAQASRAMLLVGAQAKLGCDHENYSALCVIPADTLASLVGDFS